MLNEENTRISVVVIRWFLNESLDISKPPVKDDLINCFQVGGDLSKLDQVGSS